jgi:hypothetical protein
MVNTIQKVDKLLSDKPKRKRTPIKRNVSIEAATRTLIDSLLVNPSNELIGNLNYVIDNLNELSTSYTITIK